MMTNDDLKAEFGIYVESLDGETYGGNSFSDIVTQMRDASWGGEQSDGIRGYMKQVAKRIWDWSQTRIRINTPEAFLRDMEGAKLLKIRMKP